MSLPTRASASVEIDAPPATVYDLVADVTQMGRWSPECHTCEWLDEPGQVGSKFKGRNRRGPARWTTTAEVVVADRPSEFTFATIYRGQVSTRWSYRFEGTDRTVLTESFESVKMPAPVAFVEKWFIRNRQQQLEEGLAGTLAAIKAAAERS